MNDKVHSYQDLKVWQQGMSLAKACYLTTRSFPKDELFGLTAEIRRAAAGIPANIAEGYGRESTGEYIQFLRVAQGSLKELETHLILSREVATLNAAGVAPLLAQCDQIGRMIRSLQNRRRSKE